MSARQANTKVEVDGGMVSAVIDGLPDAPATIVLGHGAGAGMKSDYMEFFALGLAAAGSRVLRFNFLYMEQARKAPDRQPVLEATFKAVIEHVRSIDKPSRLVIGGKSLGGRIASYVAAAGGELSGLVFLGYPLHPPGRPDRIRDEHLRDIRIPMLFVEGTRDPFCPLDTLESARKNLKAPNDLVVIADGDHSLKVRKSSGRSTAEAWDEAVAAIAEWIGRL